MTPEQMAAWIREEAEIERLRRKGETCTRVLVVWLIAIGLCAIGAAFGPG